jgi:osmoprotectant transport system substrate-binding protein
MALVGCGRSGSSSLAPSNMIVVASFNFPESELLAQIYGQALQAAGFPVSWAIGIGPRELVEPAMERGLVGLVPEYEGSALAFVAGAGAPASETARTHDLLAAALAPRGLTVLLPAPAEDANAVVVTRATALRLRLSSISDLAPVASGLTFGGPPECLTRPLCLPGLKERYGLTFARFVAVDPSRPLAGEALATGEVDVALLFTTDQEIAARDLVILQDDRGLQPAENVTPIIRTDILRRFGTRVSDVLDQVSARLTTSELAGLNLLVGTRERTAAQAAHDWLVLNGLG